MGRKMKKFNFTVTVIHLLIISILLIIGGCGGGSDGNSENQEQEDLVSSCVEISYELNPLTFRTVPVIYIVNSDTDDTIATLQILFVEACVYDDDMNPVACWTNLEQDENGYISNLDISIGDNEFGEDENDYNYPLDACKMEE